MADMAARRAATLPPPSRYCKRKEPPGMHLRNQPAKGGRGVGTPGRAAQMPVAEGLPAHAAGPDRSGLPGRSRQACGSTPRQMVVMGHPGRRSGPGTAGRQRKPAETAAGHHHLVQPLGAFLLPVVSPQQHAYVFRLAAARRPAGRRRLASGSQGARARSGRSVRHPGRAGPRALEKAGRHLCAAAWLGEQTPTDKLLEKAVDDWNSPTDMKLIIQAWSGGGRIVPKGLWRKPDAIRCWAALTDRGGPGRGRTARLRRLGARPCGRGNRKTHVRMMLASGAKPDLPDGNGRFPEEAARRSGASAELLRLLAAPPAANGRRARTVRPNGTNRHPRRPDPRPRFSTAAQRSNPEILQQNGSVSGKNRIRNRFRFERVKREYAPKGSETVSAERTAHAEIRRAAANALSSTA